MSCRCTSFIILSPGVLLWLNNDVFYYIRLVTWTLSTFQRVGKWNSKIWLGMSCSCAIRFSNFCFHYWSQIRVGNWCFLSESRNLNSLYPTDAIADFGVSAEHATITRGIATKHQKALNEFKCCLFNRRKTVAITTCILIFRQGKYNVNVTKYISTNLILLKDK